MRMMQALILLATLCTPAAAWAQSNTTVLFIGNSFTYGHGSPVRFYRSDTVTDLNNTGIGGVPALFKSFTAQSVRTTRCMSRHNPAAAWTSISRIGSAPSGGEPGISWSCMGKARLISRILEIRLSSSTLVGDSQNFSTALIQRSKCT